MRFGPRFVRFESIFAHHRCARRGCRCQLIRTPDSARDKLGRLMVAAQLGGCNCCTQVYTLLLLIANCADPSTKSQPRQVCKLSGRQTHTLSVINAHIFHDLSYCRPCIVIDYSHRWTITAEVL